MSVTAQILEKVNALEQRLAAAEARRVTGAQAVPAGAPPFTPGHPPAARMGESILSSRPFSFGKAMLLTNGAIRPEDAKIEDEFCARFKGNLYRHGWRPDKANGNTMLVPIWPDAFNPDQLDEPVYQEMKQLTYQDPRRIDWNEVGWWQGKSAATPASPAQSWIDPTLGGSFVPPPTFGPPIELLRNQEALLTLGATVVPLGPSGRLQMPRLTKATQGGWAGENTGQTPTQAGTGSLTLSAKKVIAVVALPNELLRFGSPATELLVRNDIFKTVALIMDKGFLDGPGSDNIPLGLATMGAAANNPYGMAIVSPASANTLSPQDVGSFISGVLANNGKVTGWLMRPELFYSLYMVRGGVYTGSGTAQKGNFVFDVIHRLDGKPPEVILGYPAVLTPQVSITRGNGSQSYAMCADWPNYLMGLFGAIEFTQTDAGYTLLASDQVAIRAVLSCDGGPKNPGVFAFLDSISLVAGS